MNLKRICLLALFAAGSMVFATVDFRTTIRDVYVDGTCEETGIITFSVNGDDFPTASTATPVYIRLRLDHAAKLCKTLVWTRVGIDGNPDPVTVLPIFLPISFEENLLGDTIAALPETVSIVRWKRGEPEIWLKVQTPTDTWVAAGGVSLGPPQNTRRVRWTIGVTARTSWEANQPQFMVGEANLPSATRTVVAPDMTTAVSTLICVDLTSSNLEPLPEPAELSILNFDPVSFDWTTTGVDGPDAASTPAGIFLGPQVQTSYSVDTRIARGYDFICIGTMPDKVDPFVVAPLCLTPGSGQFGQADGLVCITNTKRVRVNCGSSWGFHRFSVVHLETPIGSSYGFLVDLDDDGDPIDASDVEPSLPENIYYLLDGALSLSIASSSAYGAQIFSAQPGIFLTRDAEVQYTGVGVQGTIEFVITATVCMWYEEDPTDVVLDTTIFASNRDGVLDDLPYNGPDQVRFCDPSLRLAYQFDWNFGRFVECRSISCARIFFQYVPRVFDTDFFAGLAIVNQGSGDLTSVEGFIYEADGSSWDVDFGPLPLRNQKTYLYGDADGVVGFEDVTDGPGGPVIVPVSNDGDLVLGDHRSSMFVVGCIELFDSLGASGADIDGYLLIGAGDSVTGAYPARNFEISRFDRDPDQDGDLPVQYDKQGLKFRTITVQDVMNNILLGKRR